MSAPAAPSAPGYRTMALALGAMTAVQALATMATLTVSVYAPQAASALGVSPAAIGLYASLMYVGAMLGTLTAGGFVLRYGAVRFTQAVLLVVGLGLGLCVAGHWLAFALSAVVLGLGYGPTTPASSHLLNRHTPHRVRSLVFSVKQTGVPLGGLLAGLLVPFLLGYTDWRGVTLAVVVIVAAAAVLLEPLRRRFDDERDPVAPLLRGNVLGPLRLALSRAELRALTIATFFFSATQQTYVYFLVTWLEVGQGWATVKAGLALSTLGAAAMAGRVLWGAAADASGRSRLILAVMAFATALAVAATAAFSPAWPAWAVFGVCACFGATGVSWNGVFLAEIARRAGPGEVSRATGGALFVTYAGVVVGPPVFGLLGSLTGSFASGYALLAFATAGVGVRLLRGGNGAHARERGVR